jgi:hypothetical protein
VNIYVAAVEALRKKGGVETQFTTKIGGKTCLGPSYLGKMKEGMKLNLPPKLVENLVWASNG